MELEKRNQGLRLKVSDLAFSFESCPSPLFEKINCEFKGGNRAGIVGLSGSGKSTFLKLLAGLLVPKKGAIWVNDQLVSRRNLKESRLLSQNVGVSFQKGGLLDSFNVWENIDFALKELTELSLNERQERIQEALRRVDLLEVKDRRLKELSGGMLKRLSLARVFALEPPILLLDDPTAGLDPITSSEITDLIMEYCIKQETILVFTTSDLSVCYQLANQISFLARGMLTRSQAPEDFRNSQEPMIQQFVNGTLTGPLTSVEDA